LRVLEYFLPVAALVGLGMLVWNCVEVGRNDACNLVNAVFGARALRRNVAVTVAAVAVVLGATAGSPVIDTARQGMFDPSLMTVQMAMAIYISVYFVNTVMLYGFSAFGMPVSTTACMVFSLIGAALFLSGGENVDWPRATTVVTAIVISIVISGIASFLFMRIFRGAIRDKTGDPETVMAHGPWIAGLIMMGLAWFLVFKGLRGIEAVRVFKSQVFDTYGEPMTLLFIWAAMTLVTHLFLAAAREWGARYLFHAMAVLGMVAMAFAFGQNDLANCAAPGLAAFTLWRGSVAEGRVLTDIAGIAAQVSIPMWALFACGVLMASGMFTPYAQRVTRAAVNTASQFDQVDLYAPKWCKALARLLVKRPAAGPSLAPEPARDERGKKIHFDTLRAAVITGISAGVIAYASGRGLPVSTTYVAFAAILGTGISDRVFSTRGDAELKVGRAIWVVTCWFIAPVISIVATGAIVLLVYHLAIWGMAAAMGLNLLVRWLIKRRSDRHESIYHLHHGAHDGDDGMPLEEPEKDAARSE
jgi:phosphate/sulfate permease